MKRSISFVILLLAVGLCSCRTVPISSRRQLLLSSDAEEQQLGATALRSTRKNTPFPRIACKLMP